MKAVNVKKLGWVGLSLVLLTLASCGSDNKAVEVQTNTASPDTSGSTTTTGVSSCVTVSNFEEFKSNVISGNFVAQSSRKEQYTYQECEFFWKGSGEKCLSSFKRISTKDVENITHKMASTKSELLSDLTSIVNSEVSSFPITTSKYSVEVGNGDVYEIDLCRPLAANPTAFKNDDEKYYMINTFYYY